MSQRVERVQKLARRVIGEEIGRLKDPRIGFVTVTGLRMTPDLRHARVFVSLMGDAEERSATLEGLQSATSHLRTELGRQVRLKHLPELLFEVDTTADTAAAIESLLRKIHEESPGGGR